MPWSKWCLVFACCKSIVPKFFWLSVMFFVLYSLTYVVPLSYKPTAWKWDLFFLQKRKNGVCQHRSFSTVSDRLWIKLTGLYLPNCAIWSKRWVYIYIYVSVLCFEGVGGYVHPFATAGVLPVLQKKCVISGARVIRLSTKPEYTNIGVCTCSGLHVQLNWTGQLESILKRTMLGNSLEHKCVANTKVANSE